MSPCIEIPALVDRCGSRAFHSAGSGGWHWPAAGDVEETLSEDSPASSGRHRLVEQSALRRIHAFGPGRELHPTQSGDYPLTARPHASRLPIAGLLFEQTCSASATKNEGRCGWRTFTA